MPVHDVDKLIANLRRAEIEPTAFNLEILRGMLDLGVDDMDTCLLDLKVLIDKGATRWD